MSHRQPYGYPVPPVQTQVLVPSYRCSTAHVVVAWVLAVLSAAYLLPWAVAATRHRSNVAAIAMINLFLGWSLIGWVVALVMACGSDRPTVLVQTYVAPPQQPWTPPQQPWAQTPQPPVLPAAPPRSTAPEHTMVDPSGNERTQALARSPWEPDHRR